MGQLKRMLKKMKGHEDEEEEEEEEEAEVLIWAKKIKESGFEAES